MIHYIISTQFKGVTEKQTDEIMIAHPTQCAVNSVVLAPPHWGERQRFSNGVGSEKILMVMFKYVVFDKLTVSDI